MNEQRRKCIMTIARQIALDDECIWDKIKDKQRIRYMTLASNILATVERFWGGTLL
jgi:hypothetical protein